MTGELELGGQVLSARAVRHGRCELLLGARPVCMALQRAEGAAGNMLITCILMRFLDCVRARRVCSLWLLCQAGDFSGLHGIQDL